MEEKENFYKGLLNMQPNGIIIIDHKSNILFNNSKALQFLDANNENLREKILSFDTLFDESE
jgi:hypothetical protein